MHLIWTIIIGFVAGLIAKALTPGAGPGGFFLTAALGIAGSLAATYIGQALGLYPPGHAAGFIASIIGAIVLLLGYHLFTRNRVN
ncbi:GlsB/YeaQ/YmgE family stress response membrane protein [Noviherbaspirillum pedocola]|uniref:GlsB/YeaQ/YmgE family stress response membrane protein n=1 Tax=Noviherbaspirillum pedocola TaxID=2801341 RepID=A0A934STQ5_9BURK|nr:GlsB/YeaQ/YmgE family stress response membrane protein [Noviherbaspirillum pedocola]MBK4735502.1 GlsB/YeaQ/YmgE family stress response membrane protein [Noviherbaspirillum pedocola]